MEVSSLITLLRVSYTRSENLIQKKEKDYSKLTLCKRRILENSTRLDLRESVNMETLSKKIKLDTHLLSLSTPDKVLWLSSLLREKQRIKMGLLKKKAGNQEADLKQREDQDPPLLINL